MESKKSLNELADLRREYKKKSLNVSELLSDPIEQFEIWFKEASKSEITDPNAMTLATVDKNNQPATRIVLVKGADERGFIFYTNYTSAKAKELEENPNCSLLFFWPELERQLRIDGVAEKLSEEESRMYFHSRPRESQIGAWASRQSSEMESNDDLEIRFKKYSEKFANDTVIPYPEFWGGYVVKPHKIEFWQGRPNRLHDRMIFLKDGKNWNVKRLYP